MTLPNWRNRILAADLVWGVLAMCIAYVLRYGWVWKPPDNRSAVIFVPPLVLALGLWAALSAWQRMDGFRGGWRFSAIVSHLLLGVSALMAFLLAAAYLLRHYISRLTLGYFGALLFLGFVAIRCVVRLHLASRYRTGHARKVVIVGNGSLAAEIVHKIKRHPELNLEVVGFLNPEDAPVDSNLSGKHAQSLRVFSVEVAELLRAQQVDDIVLAVSKPGHPEILDLTTRCLRQNIGVSVVPQPYELYVSKPELLDVDGLPLLQLRSTVPTSAEPRWKRPFDVALGLALLPVCVPLLLCGAALLKIRKGRAFCTERRCGKNGVAFSIYRLNSPRHAPGLPRYEVILQQLSITELPQLFNVLLGDMSLVGPRPEGFDRARHYTDWQSQRLLATPGMTGLAQVYGLRDQHSSEDKTCYDLQYLLHRSIFQDISLLVQTAWTLTGRLLHIPQLQPNSAKLQVPPTTEFKETFAHAHRSQSSAH